MPDIIDVPRGTRLDAVVMHDDGRIDLWIATKHRGNKYADWRGTYISVEADGCVMRITNDDIHDECFVIREASNTHDMMHSLLTEYQSLVLHDIEGLYVSD